MRLGEYDLSKSSVAEKEYVVKSIKVYPSYSPSSIGIPHDVALLELRDVVAFTSAIRPICMPTSEWVLDGQLAYTAGNVGLCLIFHMAINRTY